jgi:hypothetical protein
VGGALAVGFALALVGASCTSGGSGNDDTGSTDVVDPGAPAGRPEDPMAAVNASVVFDPSGSGGDGPPAGDGSVWLDQAGATARWGFGGFPGALTDLKVEASVVAPTPAVVDGSVTVPVSYGHGDDVVASLDVALPVTGPAGSLEEAAATGSFMIPVQDLSDDLDDLWVEISGSADRPVAVHEASIHFAPLRLTAGVSEGEETPEDDDGTTSSSTGSSTTASQAPAPAPAPTTEPGQSPVPAEGTFSSNGDEISGWWWLRDDAGSHRATWAFPLGDSRDDLVLGFSMLATDRVSGGPGVDARFYLSYTFTGADGSELDTADSQLVTLPNVSPPEDTLGYRCEGSVTIDRAAVPAGATGLRVTASRVDPGRLGEDTTEHVAFNAGALTVSDGGSTSTTSQRTTTTTRPTTTGPTTTRPTTTTAPTTTTTEDPGRDIEEPPFVTVTWDGDDHALDSSGSIFVDPATDIDGDGLNQNFEDRAIEKANPVIEVDEEELWLHFSDDHPTVNFAQATLWPSAEDPTHLVIGYLNTWSYDPGGGLQQPLNLVYEHHRGDSERIFTAWRLVGDDRAELEWVNTSAHKSYTDHGGVWHADDRQCTVANTARVVTTASVPPFSAGYGFSEVMCDVVEYHDDGRVLVYAAENKHAMYPGSGLCESVTIGRLAVTGEHYGEDCGWDPGWWPGQWDDDDFGSDRYLGDGRWDFRTYNVGEPDHHLIDDLDDPSSWQRVDSAARAALTGVFPGEAVWSGRSQGSDFCGGFDEGDEIALDWRDDLEMPAACSSKLGGKFEEWDGDLTAALGTRYRVWLKTANDDGAGTDEQIGIQLVDTSDRTLAEQTYQGDLERNATDVVYLPNTRWTPGTPATSIGRVGVRVWRVTGGNDRGPRWHLGEVRVHDTYTGETWIYFANTWLNAGRANGWSSD